MCVSALAHRSKSFVVLRARELARATNSSWHGGGPVTIWTDHHFLSICINIHMATVHISAAISFYVFIVRSQSSLWPGSPVVFDEYHTIVVWPFCEILNERIGFLTQLFLPMSFGAVNKSVYIVVLQINEWWKSNLPGCNCRKHQTALQEWSLFVSIIFSNSRIGHKSSAVQKPVPKFSKVKSKLNSPLSLYIWNHFE